MKSSFIHQLFEYALISTLMVTPLIFVDAMMWPFHAPKELFFQFAVGLMVLLQFLRPETDLEVNPPAGLPAALSAVADREQAGGFFTGQD